MKEKGISAFKFCPECGEKLPDLNAKFCPFCGARLELQPETNAKTNGTEPPKEAAPEDKESMATKAYEKHEPLKNAAKIAKHGWKFKIAVTLLIIVIATNTVYYFDVFKIDPALQPAQQIMDQIWSVPGLAQMHQAILQVTSSIWRGLTRPPNLTGVPSAPTGVEATAGDGQVTISWSAVSGATSYNIYYSTTSGVTKTTGTKITGVTSPYTRTGLTNGTTYYYIATAVNSSGESVKSAQVSATPTNGSENLTGKIVFTASEEEDANQRAVYVMNTDGSNLTQLTDYSIGAGYPVWSPDGKRIAFAALKDGGIYTINADGTNLTRIVYKTVYDVYTDKWYIAGNDHPSWSPDGSMICYESYGDADSGTTVQNANIYVVNSDGTGMRRLTNDLSYKGQPSWSPDGSKIAFVYVKDEGDGYSNYHIYVMNAGGSNWVQLTDRNITVNNLNPDWSPDGTQIVFTGDGDEHQGVFCINLQDKSQKFIGVIGGCPKWSPDGTKIITDGWESRRGVVRIWITNADGSNTKEIETPMGAHEPDWMSHTTDIPSAPTGVTATAGDGQATISWSSVTGATSYNIYWSTTPGVTKSNGQKIPGVASPYTRTGLTNGVTYYYFVTAVNSSGESVESAQKSATPTGPGPARDLTGTWVDLPGEGLVVTPLNGPHRFHYDITMDIVQSGNTFTGTMYISLWNAEALVPYSPWVDDGYWNFSYPGSVQTEQVTNGVISGVNIQFQVIGWTWKGTFTTDQMSGTVQGYSSGVYSGVFTLRREW